jgi:hypothetical protein
VGALKALRVTFELISGQRNASGYDLGHVTLEGSHGTATSKGRSPDQAMMLFLSVPDFLLRLREWAINPKRLGCEFEGTDSSFSFEVRRKGLFEGEVVVDGTIMHRAPTDEIVRELWHGVDSFLIRHELHEGDMAKEDLRLATQEFRRALGI